MLVPCIYDGMTEKTSSKGNTFATIFVRGVDEDGNAEVEQRKYISFDELVIAKLKTKAAGDCVNLDLTIKDATVTGIGV